MARLLYGCTAADYTITSGGRVIPNAELTVWDAIEGGTQITDLTDYDGNPVETVTSEGTGFVRFYGPDGENDNLWLDSGQNSRVLVRPTVITADIGDGSILDEDIAADADIDRSKIAGTALTADSMGVFSVLDYGAVGDGSHDDTAAIQTALDAASAAKGTVLIPSGTYKTTATLFPGSDTTIIGTGTIDAHILTGEHVTGQDPVFFILADDVHIEGITIVGNKAEYAAATEFKHGISIASSNRVTIRNVTTTLNKGDGVCVMAGGGIGSGNGDPCTQIVLDNVTSEHNHRQGLSVTSVIGLRVVGGSYSYTDGAAPQAGIDIESDIAEHRIEAVDIVDVTAQGNTGAGIMVVTGLATDGKGVRISGGLLADNNVGVWLHNTRSTIVEGSTIVDSVGSGIYADGEFLHDARIDANTIKDNAQEGIRINVPSSTGSVQITRNVVLDNNTSGSALYWFGIFVDTSGTVYTAYNRVGDPEGTGTQEYGLWTSDTVVAETHVGNVLLYGDALGNRLTANQASAETDTTGFYNAGDVTLSRDTSYKVHGAASLKATANSTATYGTDVGSGTSSAVVTGGETITIQALVRCSASKNLQARAYWRDSGGGAVSFDEMGLFPVDSSGFALIEWTGVAPATSHYVIPDLVVAEATAPGETLNFECLGVWGGRGGRWRMPGAGAISGVGAHYGASSTTVIDDDAAILPGALEHTGSGLGFFGAPVSTKPAVAGARDESEGALASLIAQLANLGLITDSTTAS